MDIAPLSLLKNKKRGFTLIEIVIVISILALLAALSFILAMNAFITSNESAAQQGLNVFRTGMEKYRNINFMYPPDLATLGVGNPSYVDPVLASGTRRGYTYTLSNTGTNTYTITATPQQPNVTGRRSFQVDQSGEIFDITGP